ncbi:MAG: four helix bundle protein [Flavobacteriaceae bacterium]
MTKTNKNITRRKSFEFAFKIIRLVQRIQESKKEYVLSKQLLRSGTSIGALVSEAEHAESRKDFTHKMNIGLKEANETRYWLELSYKTDYIDNITYSDLHNDITELIRLLASIVKSSKM